MHTIGTNPLRPVLSPLIHHLLHRSYTLSNTSFYSKPTNTPSNTPFHSPQQACVDFIIHEQPETRLFNPLIHPPTPPPLHTLLFNPLISLSFSPYFFRPHQACVDFIIHEQPETRMEEFISELGILPLSDILHRAAQKHADTEGYLVVVLATSGYADMLANFLCSATAPPVNNNHILVITPNQDIADIARHFGVGSYMPPSARQDVVSKVLSSSSSPPDTGPSSPSSSSLSSSSSSSTSSPSDTGPSSNRHPPLLSLADFGTLQYQVMTDGIYV